MGIFVSEFSGQILLRNYPVKTPFTGLEVGVAYLLNTSRRWVHFFEDG